jgi:hypothetical protein
MCAANVEEEIVKLGSEVSGIYFQAKETLTQLQDSRSERFSAAARIVRAFWKRVVSTRQGCGIETTLLKSLDEATLSIDRRKPAECPMQSRTELIAAQSACAEHNAVSPTCNKLRIPKGLFLVGRQPSGGSARIDLGIPVWS